VHLYRMTHRSRRRRHLSWLLLVVAHASCMDGAPSTGEARHVLEELSETSQVVTWTCTASPCPWGDSLANPAIAWPTSAEPTATRLGYTASPAPYLSADQANGATVSITSGTASLYAGVLVVDSHRLLATLSAGQLYQVTGLASDEVLSVQSSAAFQYQVTPAPAPDPDVAALNSQTATWTCTDSPCPWGTTLTGHALAWAADAGAISKRLGYTVSPAIYLPASRANGTAIAIVTGQVGVYAGRPHDSVHRQIASLSAGQSFEVSGLSSGEVLSVQSDAPFSYRVQLCDPTDPTTGEDVVHAIAASWVCNIPACSGDPWTGAVINWPDWAAYPDNARAGFQSRSVFASDNTPLFPYMGRWAEGCEVTDVSGPVLIIEWQRGTDVWRETLLQPGQSHTIHLVPPEDGAMIETLDAVSSFSVSLKHCTPQALP